MQTSEPWSHKVFNKKYLMPHISIKKNYEKNERGWVNYKSWWQKRVQKY